uniref:Uncharacterized protein n=1 Tax=Rhizophora mucronata TaxID=61149 RepID=A0A2P2MZY8_RHIMU
MTHNSISKRRNIQTPTLWTHHKNRRKKLDAKLLLYMVQTILQRKSKFIQSSSI